MPTLKRFNTVLIVLSITLLVVAIITNSNEAVVGSIITSSVIVMLNAVNAINSLD